jgi:hypothetical protein
MEPAASSAQGSFVGVRLHIGKPFPLAQISIKDA